MGTSGLGQKRQSRASVIVSLKGLERRCRSTFFDSGAHSLYNLHVLGNKNQDRYTWYARDGKLTKEFRKYLDAYAGFIKKHGGGLDYYATVDAIYSPEVSWQSLKYLEDQGIKPVPVIHHRTPLSWVVKHLEAGYQYIGLGGLGQESTKGEYYRWADSVFDLLCDNPQRLPCVRGHGFAMTSYDLLLRYPWWSVDSSSVFKCAGFGSIYVPHKRKGEFTFGENPYVIAFSHRSTAEKVGKHYRNLNKAERTIVREWLDSIDLKVGKVKDGEMAEYGVLSSYNARVVANLRFFERLCDWLPEWPWPFHKKPARGFFNLEGV